MHAKKKLRKKEATVKAGKQQALSAKGVPTGDQGVASNSRVAKRVAEKKSLTTSAQTVGTVKGSRELTASGHVVDLLITPNSHGLYLRLRELEEAQVEQRRKELAVARFLANI